MEENFDEYGNKIVNDCGSIVFDCPKCGNSKIVRSRKARELSKEYTCSKCDFVGP